MSLSKEQQETLARIMTSGREAEEARIKMEMARIEAQRHANSAMAAAGDDYLMKEFKKATATSRFLKDDPRASGDGKRGRASPLAAKLGDTVLINHVPEFKPGAIINSTLFSAMQIQLPLRDDQIQQWTKDELEAFLAWAQDYDFLAFEYEKLDLDSEQRMYTMDTIIVGVYHDPLLGKIAHSKEVPEYGPATASQIAAIEHAKQASVHQIMQYREKEFERLKFLLYRAAELMGIEDVDFTEERGRL